MEKKVHFDEAVKAILREDNRYAADAYRFLREALDHTVTELRKGELEEHRHVTGPELLRGVVAHALKEFGPMAAPVFDSWGVREGDDVGAMVFNLIEARAFGRSEEDSPSDFNGVLNLREELQAPFRPSRPVLSPARHAPEGSGTEPPARGNQPAKSGEI